MIKISIERSIWALALLFGLDRLLKLAAVAHFFRRPPPPAPARWPTVTLLQPITRGVHGLAGNLGSRLALDYPAPIQHLLICDAHDTPSQATCHALAAAYPAATIELVLVAAPPGAVASKIEKLRAALPQANGAVLCFVDDDVALRPGALRTLLPYLDTPGAGAAFGLACYTSWRNAWSSALSGFVNANALLSYIPLTYLTQPFTITGHCYALRRATFDAAGGFEQMDGRIDDDHELARRLRRHGLGSAQTPMIYDVANDLPTAAAYLAQMQRWFVLPRRLMAPYLAPHDQLATVVGGAGMLLPSLIALLALLARTRGALAGLATTLAMFLIAYLHTERRYLGRATPPGRLPIVALGGLLAPLQIVWALLAGDQIVWRGQRLRLGRDGAVEVLE